MKSPIPQLSDEQFEWVQKLGPIFLPLSDRRGNQLEKQQIEEGGEPGYFRFVHYTSADAALKIISNKTLWLRNTNCMSDYNEVLHGHSLLVNSFQDAARKARFVAALEACAPGVAADAIAKFDTSWNEIRFHTYVGCLSEHDKDEDEHGRLSMWRAFGNSPSRVGLVFKVPRYSGANLALNVLFSPVLYLSGTQVNAWIDEVTTNINREQAFLKTVPGVLVREMVYAMLMAAVTCLKHEGFKEEREWRAICCPTIRPSNILKPETEVIFGVPQCVFKVPLDSSNCKDLEDLEFSKIFDRLIIGPSQFAWPMSEAFRDALTKAGVKDAASRVWPSRIPIRS